MILFIVSDEQTRYSLFNVTKIDDGKDYFVTNVTNGSLEAGWKENANATFFLEKESLNTRFFITLRAVGKELKTDSDVASVRIDLLPATTGMNKGTVSGIIITMVMPVTPVDGLSAASIAGIVIGSLIGLILLVGVGICVGMMIITSEIYS